MNINSFKDRRFTSFFSLIIVASLMIIVVVFLFLNGLEKKNRKDEAENLLLLVQRNETMLENWVVERKTDLQLLASNTLLVEKLSNYKQNAVSPNDTKFIIDLLFRYRTQKKYRDVFFTDINGKVLISANSKNNYSKALIINDWKAGLLNKDINMGDMKRSEISHDEIVLDFYLPVFRETNHDVIPVGFLVLRASPQDFIYPMLDNLPRKSKTTESNLVEKQGDNVVYLNQLKHKSEIPFRFSLPLSTPNLTAAMAANDMAGSYIGKDYAGNKVIAAMDSVRFTKWHLIAKIDYKEALSGFYAERILIFVILLILIAFVLAILINRGIKQKFEILTMQNENEDKHMAILKHFEYLFKNANDIILLTDFDGKIVEANGKAENMYGYSYDELKGMNIYQITAPEFHELSKGIETSPDISTGRVYEVDHIRRSGEHFPVEISAVAITVGDKQFIQRIIRDISERKLAEKQLLDLNKQLECKVTERTKEVKEVYSKLEGFFKVSIDLLAIANSEGYFLQLNPEWEKVLGYTIEELTNRKYLDFVHPDDLQSSLDALKVMSQETPLKHFITQYLCKDGTYKFLEWNVAPESDLQYISAHDITDSKIAEDKISALNTVLMNTNKELESFSYSVSHDLRAPLRSMEGYSSALRNGYADKIDEQGVHYLDRIQNAAVKMSTLINDMLELSQLGQKQLSFQIINLSDIANKVAIELKEAYPEQKISFRIAETTSISADSDLMKIVFKNLLDNSRKFSAKKEVSEIVFASKKEKGQTVYYVQDNGEGFDMEYADKLFTPFQRYHHAENFAGTGIGLSIVFRIINRHNGMVWVESTIENGTTVFFTINSKGE